MSEPDDERDGPTASPRYVDARAVGQGSMGEVLVVHDELLGRDVALKILRTGRQRVLQRFLRERRITAQLEHPSIVPVHDAGERPDGRPYYTMAYLRGTELKAAIRGARTMADRLALIPVYSSVCQAIAYAHSRGVIHRDIKPSNVMLGSFGEAVVVDWGLARFLDDSDDPAGDSLDLGDTLQTQVGRITGTPSYMSPEQARGEEVDRRGDVYALGAVLYEILSGSPPHGRGAIEAVLARAAAGEVRPLHQVAPQAPRELVAIVERALAKSPEARYPDAGALSEDVSHWLAGLPVDAYAYSGWERFRRYTARNWRWLLPTTLGVLGIAVATSVGVVNVRQQRDRARANEERALSARDTAEEALATALAERARLAARIEDGLSAQVLAAEALTHAPSPAARGVLAGAWSGPDPQLLGVLPAPHACSGIAFVGHDLLCSGQGTTTRLRRDGSVVWTAPVSNHRIEVDGAEAILSGNRTHRLDLHTGAVLGSDEATESIRLDGRWLTRDRFHVQGGGHELTSGGSLARLRRVDDEAWLLALSGRHWQLGDEGWEPRGDLKMVSMDLAADEGWIAVAGTEVRVRSRSSDTWRSLPVESEVYQLELGREVLLGGAVDQSVYVWDRSSWERIGRLPDHGGSFAAVALGPDGTWATSGGDEIRLWQRSHQAPQRVWLPESHSVVSGPGWPTWVCVNDGELLRAEPGSRALVPYEHPMRGGTSDCTMDQGSLYALYTGRVLRVDPDGTTAILEVPAEANSIAVAGGQLLTLHRETGRLWTERGELLQAGHVLGTHDGAAIAVGPSGVFALRADGTRGLDRALQPGQGALALVDGRLLLQDPSGALQLEDLRTPTNVLALEGHRAAATIGLAAEIDGQRRLITAGWDHQLIVWDLETGALLARLDGHDARVLELGWDGRFVWSTSFDQTVRTWDLSVLAQEPGTLVDTLRRRTGLAVRDGVVAFVGPP